MDTPGQRAAASLVADLSKQISEGAVARARIAAERDDLRQQLGEALQALRDAEQKLAALPPPAPAAA